MTNTKKFIEAAGDDWSHDRFGDQLVFTRYDVVVGDGYASTVVIKLKGEEGINGVITTGLDPYGETEEFELGTRNLIQILSNVNNPFRYKPFHEAFTATNPAAISEKVLAARVNESERQVRNARVMGFMSGYLADKMCIILLGKHPMELYGFDAWCNHESAGAWPSPPKKRNR